jgi:5-methylcytosine-specific restriction endonuclease McrA
MAYRDRRAYADKLTDPRWLSRRFQIIERDHSYCTFCGAFTDKPQVHHKRYIRGLNPWEYDDDDLTTLCPECHQYVHEIGVELP